MTRAKSEDKKAQYELALVYYFNLGDEVDPSKGFYWARLSAEQGVKEAEKFVAAAYRVGLGTTVDKQKALEWSAKTKK